MVIFLSDTLESRLSLKVYPLGKKAYLCSNGLFGRVKKGKKRFRLVMAAFEEITASAMREVVQGYNRRPSKGANPFVTDLSKLTFNIFLDDHFMPKKQKPLFNLI